MKEYMIMTVTGPPRWEDVPVLQLDSVLWTPDVNVRAEGQLCAGPDALHVHMRAVEEDIRAEYTEPLSPVYKDSCLEFFFMPEPGENYFNLEMNPNGCTAIQYGKSGADRVSLVREDEKEYFDIHTNRTADGWEMFCRIPLEFIRLFHPGYTFTGVMRANMYKCGGSTRHFLSWSPVLSEKPEFHRPQDFGEMRFERHHKQTDKEMTMDIKTDTVKTDSFSMDWLSFGEGDKTMVILPGLSVQSVMGLGGLVAEAYKMFAADYTVYMFDRRKELPDSYSIREMAEDTAEAMRALGLSGADVMGASQGGMIGMQIAVMYPDLVHKLVLCSTAPCVGEEQFGEIEKWIRLAKAGDREGLYLAFGEAVYPAEVFEQSRKALADAAKTVTDEELERFVVLADMKDFDVTDDIKKIGCPVLVLGSMDDKVLGCGASFKIAENLSGSKGLVLQMYDGYGHAAYDFAPGYKESILGFLSAE